MSSLENEHEIHELEFLEKNFESSDEFDGVSEAVIALEKDSETEYKYTRRKSALPPYHYQSTIERILRREKVSSSWGRCINKVKSSGRMTNGSPALLSFEAGEASPSKHIDDTVIAKLNKAIWKFRGEILKYSDLQILAAFEGTGEYEEFGKRFMDGEIEEINGFRLMEVKAVSVINHYPCFLEVSCSPTECPKLQAAFSSFFVSFCSRFSCISIRETTQKAVDSVSPTHSSGNDGVPAISMMMRFISRAQRNAQKLIQAIKMDGYDWKEFSLPKEITESGQTVFKSSYIPGMSISIQQGSPFAGIKIMLFVNNNLEEMANFYSFITGKLPLVVDRMEDGLRYRTYSLSKKLELQLVSHPEIKPRHSKSVNLCFPINDVNQILSKIPGGAWSVGEKHWQVTDPDGNILVLYHLLRV